MPRGVPLTVEEDRLIVFHYVELCKSYREIREELGYANSAVRGALARQGIDPRPRGGDNNPSDHRRAEQVAFLYTRCDLSIYDAGTVLGIHPRTVHEYLRRGGIPRRSRAEGARYRALKRYRPRPLPTLKQAA